MDVNKITPLELSTTLQAHLSGTPLEQMVQEQGIKVDIDGYVAAATVDSLCGLFGRTLEFFADPCGSDLSTFSPNVQAAMDAIKPYRTKQEVK
jgi:hypothetical protein